MGLLGPSVHLTWPELACHDGTPYPARWRDDRAHILAMNFEACRELLGGVPMVILSGYRTPEYNAHVEGSAQHSQHVEGRAVDVHHATLLPRTVWVTLRRAYAEGKLPLLGGLGIYRTFVHIDVRPKTAGHLAVWNGPGVTIPMF